MNKVILSGNLCIDPQVRSTNNGTMVAVGSVAVSRERKELDGTYATDFINIVCWNNQAEYLSKYGKKGDRVELCGRWQVRKYKAQDGSDRTANECIVENIKVFSKPQQAEAVEERPTTNNNVLEGIVDDELPF